MIIFRAQGYSPRTCFRERSFVPCRHPRIVRANAVREKEGNRLNNSLVYILRPKRLVYVNVVVVYT